MIIFDTETTGLLNSNVVDLAKQPKIIEFAAIKLDDKTLEEVDRLEFLVNPKIEIPKKITDITGIKNSTIANEKEFKDKYRDLVRFFFATKYVIAHNVSFDIRMLALELRRIGRHTQFPYPPIQICTVNQTLHFRNYRLSLSVLYDHLFHEEFKDAHRAMADVEALTKCVKELIKQEVIKI